MASIATTAVRGTIYGIAYAVIGYYLGVAIEASDIGAPGLYAWLFLWVAAGAGGLIVWTLRVTGVQTRKTTQMGGAR